MKRRRKLVRISDEMKQWSGLLESELSSWPGVTSRRMFGMLILYRKGRPFAALPQTRIFDTPRSIAFKLGHKTRQTLKLLESDARIPNTWTQNSKWISFELASHEDLKDALKWFDLAYCNCLSRNNSKN